MTKNGDIRGYRVMGVMGTMFLFLIFFLPFYYYYHFFFNKTQVTTYIKNIIIK